MQKERVAAVVEVLEEAEGRIRIEDVLPLFPDFVTIDAFKAAICASLEDYNAQIEGLKTEMADSTRIADALRSATMFSFIVPSPTLLQCCACMVECLLSQSILVHSGVHSLRCRGA